MDHPLTERTPVKLTTPQLIIVSLTFLVLCALLVVILIFDLSPAVFLSSLATVIPLLLLLYGQNKIATNTNGTLSALRAENAKQSAVIIALAAAATPQQVTAAHDVAEDTITRTALTEVTRR